VSSAIAPYHVTDRPLGSSIYRIGLGRSMRCAIWSRRGSAMRNPLYVGQRHPWKTLRLEEFNREPALAVCASEVMCSPRRSPAVPGVGCDQKPHHAIELGTADPSHCRISFYKIAILISQQCDGVTFANVNCASTTNDLPMPQRPLNNVKQWTLPR